MKKVLILTFVLLTILGTSCRNNSDGDALTKSGINSEGNAELIFSEYEHDFGQVAEGEKVAHVFTFENKGTGDLVINNVATSCGCTVTKYETKPVAPGKNGNIEVAFNTSGYNGIQAKTIKVKSNASVPVVLLKISAEVITTNSK